MQRIIKGDMEIRSRKMCSVPQCSTYGNSVISLHKFPLNPKEIKKWKIILKIGKPISKYMLVCSKHFVKDDFFSVTSTTQRKRLKNGSLPSQNLPVIKHSGVKKERSNQNRLRQKSNANEMQAKQYGDEQVGIERGVELSSEHVFNEDKSTNTDFCDFFELPQILNSDGKLIHFTGMNVENVIDLTDVNSVCRVCLNKSLKLKSLSEALEFENPEIQPTNILGALTSLGLGSVAIEELLPDKICFKCTEQLKLCIIFKHTYSKSSKILKLFASSAFQKPEKKEDNEHAYAEKSYTLIKAEHAKSIEKINEDEEEFYSPEYCEVENLESIDNDDDNLSYDRKKPVKRKKSHTCPICFKELQLSQFRPHVHRHKGLKKYLDIKVPIKAKFYALPKNTVSRVNEIEKFHSCPFCESSFQAAEYLEHVDTHLKNDSFICDKCGRVFKKRSYLIHHMLVHTKELSYRCRCCLQSFKSEDLLKSHRCILTGVGLRICRLCKKTFASSKAYFSHLRLQHKIIKRSNRQLCGECNKVVSNITLHRTRAHLNSVRKSLCSVCGLDVVNIYNHRLKHEPLKCDICGKEFVDATALKKHEMIHTGQKPFLCSSRPKTFNCQNNHQVHERIHKGDKCHVCPVCKKGFLEKSYLKKHMKIHKEIIAGTSTSRDGYRLDDDNYVIEGSGYLEGPPN